MMNDYSWITTINQSVSELSFTRQFEIKLTYGYTERLEQA